MRKLFNGRWVTAAVGCWGLVYLLYGQTRDVSTGKVRDKAEREKSIERLADLARGAPAEFAADVLLRLSQASGDPKRKRELLEEAFRLGPSARHPVRLRAALEPLPDSGPRFHSQAADLRLDGLSIQSRSLIAMLGIDPARARALFLQIAPVSLPTATCGDALVPNVSGFYDALVQLTERSFSSEERRRGDHVHFFKSYIPQIGSSLQLAPAAKAIGTLKVSSEDRQILLQALASRLNTIRDSDRSFSYALTRLRLVQNILELAELSARDGIPPHGVISEFRAYLVRQLGATRCSDTVEYEQRWRKVDVRNPIRLFNQKARPWLSSEAKLITDEENTPAKVEGRPRIIDYWDGGSAARLLKENGRLRTGGGDKFLTDEQKASATWQADAASYLSSLESWLPEEGVSEVDHFHRKCLLYAALLDFTPGGQMYERVLHTYLAFLSQHHIQRERPVEWLWHLNRLLKFARPLTDEARVAVKRAQGRGIQIPELPHVDNSLIVRELSRSRDLSLALYGSLESLLPQQRDSWN